ncbi:hypothetical protein FB451DRAFT_1557349 [Mycena latifolia]|nr:hypothetical protein FB451DRAFT_1557349 [Mycena latifolia]
MGTGPAFPRDLELEIFETTALIHPGTIPALLRVARRIHIWIEPFLYRVVSVGGISPFSDMGRAILRATKSKPASFFHNAVRHLCLDSSASWTFQEAVEVLKLCTGLVEFASDGDFLHPTLLPILGKLPLRRLSTDLYRLFDGYESIDLTHPAFVSLTHLEILDPIYDDDTRIISHFPALPALTHLRLSDNVPWKHVETLLADCLRLEVLISLFPTMKAPWAVQRARMCPIHDPRFVITIYRSSPGRWAVHQRRPSTWSLAKDFVSARRSGAVHPSCCLLNPENPSSASQ